MDREPSIIKFAAIGHQDNWEKVVRFVNTIRESGAKEALELQQIKEVYGFIPPRTIFEVDMHSSKTGSCKGVYIDTFIAPDELDAKHLRTNLQKVKQACEYAAALNIPVVSLGGFTSIILEAAGQELSRIGNTCFTTGNTLTAGFIVKGVEQACMLWEQSIEECNLLIIGATGDIGSACAKYFAGKTKKLLLCARQQGRLAAQAAAFSKQGIEVEWSTDVAMLLPGADVVICVASSLLEAAGFSALSPHTIICDAGYPKNIDRLGKSIFPRIFSGGMGVVKQGFSFDPDYRNDIYSFPVQHAVHGCLLEAIVLAMENKPCAMSVGRGNITLKAMEEMISMAASHGVYPAPLFDAGLQETINLKTYERA